MSRIVAILGGGDWADASVEHLVIPDDMILEEEKANHNDWYTTVYRPELRAGRHPKYKSFVDWLIEHGARETGDEEVLEFWDH